MAEQWQEVTQYADGTVLQDCVKAFYAVSRFLTVANFGISELRERLSEKILNASVPIPQFPRPTDLNDNIDPELKMMRLWRYHDAREMTLFTIALDRTIRRKWELGDVYPPHRNHWCVSVGVVENLDMSVDTIYAKIKDLLKALQASLALLNPPQEYRFALVWEARKRCVGDELNLPAAGTIPPYPPKQIVDMLAEKMLNDLEIKFYDVPQKLSDRRVEINKVTLLGRRTREPAYNHFKDHIESYSPVGTQAEIRSLEFTIQ